MNPFVIHSMIASGSSKGANSQSKSGSQSTREIDLTATVNTLEESTDLKIDASVQSKEGQSVETVDKSEISTGMPETV